MAAPTQEMGVDATPAAAAEPESNLLEPSYEVQVQLSDLHQDTDHPLASVASFDELGLPEKVRQGLAEMGFLKPSKVQETALPLLLANPPRNMIAQSQSGTGKTAAFVTTLLSRVDFTKPKQPQALVLAPSRELARQIQGVIQHIGNPIEELEVVAAIKGAFVEKQPIQASVIVGTPGTVLDVCKTRQLDVSQIKILVIDEADNMLDLQGMGDQCKRIRNVLPKTTQILLFSATFPDRVMKYADQFAPRSNVIRLKANELTVKGIAQMYMDCPSTADKYAILCKLYGLMNIGSSIIFVKTRDSATQIAQSMTNDGHKVSVLHGAYEGAERDALLDDFRSGRSKVLITTNVLARGIDVSTVSMVINYDIPVKGPGDGAPDTETYLHRIGRTGRFGRVGVSITFVSDKKSFMSMRKIAEELEIELVQLSPDDWDETEQKVQRVIKSSRAQATYVPTAPA